MGTSSKNKKILYLRSNGVDPDPRVEKEGRVLSSFADVFIIARDRVGVAPRLEKTEFGTLQRIRLKGGENPVLLTLTLLIWWIYLFFRLLFSRFDCLHAADFDTYFPAIVVAKLKRKPIVYDVYDFYADTFGNGWVAKAIAALDRRLMMEATAVILVDESRKKQIYPAAPRHLEIIYNIPDLENFSLDRSKLKKGTFFYAGMLSPDRAVDKLVDFFVAHPQLKMGLAGWGPVEPYIVKQASMHKNITFYGRLPYGEVLAHSIESEVVLAFYDPAIPNNRYASPNKLFESMALGKPIISNHGTALGDFIDQHQIGITVEPDLSDFDTKFMELIGDEAGMKKMGDKARSLYNSEYNWPKMAKKLKELYQAILY